MTPPLVSILIPAYRAAPWLAQTLDSALAQTHPRCEIIIIDDGSPDDTLAIARAHALRHPGRIQVATQPNSGAAAARNHGLRLATGDFIQFLDADDLIAPDKISQQLARLTSASPSAVATGPWARFNHAPAEAVFISDPLSQDLPAIDWLVSSWRNHIMMATAAWLVPRRLAEAAGPWNTELHPNPVDDMEYFSRVLLASDRVLFSPAARAYYRSGQPGTLSRQRNPTAWQSIYASFHLTADRLLARENSPRTRLATATALQRLVFESYPRMPAQRRYTVARIHELGGTDLSPDAGPRRRLLHAVLGWRLTKRLHDRFAPKP